MGKFFSNAKNSSYDIYLTTNALPFIRSEMVVDWNSLDIYFENLIIEFTLPSVRQLIHLFIQEFRTSTIYLIWIVCSENVHEVTSLSITTLHFVQPWEDISVSFSQFQIPNLHEISRDPTSCVTFPSLHIHSHPQKMTTNSFHHL